MENVFFKGWRLIAGSLPMVLWGLRVGSLEQELLIFGDFEIKIYLLGFIDKPKPKS